MRDRIITRLWYIQSKQICGRLGESPRWRPLRRLAALSCSWGSEAIVVRTIVHMSAREALMDGLLVMSKGIGPVRAKVGENLLLHDHR